MMEMQTLPPPREERPSQKVRAQAREAGSWTWESPFQFGSRFVQPTIVISNEKAAEETFLREFGPLLAPAAFALVLVIAVFVGLH